jgi:hypothetical protein
VLLELPGLKTTVKQKVLLLDGRCQPGGTYVDVGLPAAHKLYSV